MHPLKNKRSAYKEIQNKQVDTYLLGKLTSERVNKTLDMFGYYLLYVFVLCIFLNPIWIVVFADRAAGAYEYTPESSPATPTVAAPSTLTLNGTVIHIREEYRQVTPEYHRLMKQWEGQVQWTGATALLGWMCTSRRFKAGLLRLRENFKEEIKKKFF